jgi:FMN phosphatase YigB (HAD superfamily)
MHKIVCELRQKYEIALLSNFGDSFDKFEERWRTSETIKPENMFVSVKLGMRKPHKDIYEYTLNKLGLKPDEPIFIDDRSENIRTAEELGMYGIHFSDRKQFLVQLARITAND